MLRHHAYRTVGEFLSGGAVGPDSSSVKLLMAEAEQRLAAQRLFELLRARGRVLDRDLPVLARRQRLWRHAQIQRNIIADRILALPQEWAMDLELTDEQTWLERVADTLLEREWTGAESAHTADPAPQRDRLWPALVDFGARRAARGSARRALPRGAAFGAHLASTPFLGSAALRYAAGHRDLATSASRSRCSSPAAAGRSEHARRRPPVDGHKLAVEHAAEVDRFAVVATADGAPALALVAADAPGVDDRAAGLARRRPAAVTP